jgi:hypothetical protein
MRFRLSHLSKPLNAVGKSIREFKNGYENVMNAFYLLKSVDRGWVTWGTNHILYSIS